MSDINFNKNKTSQLANNKKFEYLFFIVENARKKFLSEFVTIRNNIEHNDFSISNYQLTVISDVFIVEEPLLGNRKLLDSLNFYFENICEFIELIMIYYFGINSYLKTVAILCIAAVFGWLSQLNKIEQLANLASLYI